MGCRCTHCAQVSIPHKRQGCAGAGSLCRPISIHPCTQHGRHRTALFDSPLLWPVLYFSPGAPRTSRHSRDLCPYCLPPCVIMIACFGSVARPFLLCCARTLARAVNLKHPPLHYHNSLPSKVEKNQLTSSEKNPFSNMLVPLSF